MSEFKLLSKNWTVDDQIRFFELLPIASECVGRAIVRIAYGMVFAEKELRGEWSEDEGKQT